MPAGELRHRVIIEEPHETRNAGGGVETIWTPYTGEIWASVRPLSGAERLAAAQLRAETTHQVMIRYTHGITPKMRVNFGGRILRILAIRNPKEKNVHLFLQCAEDLD